MSCGELPKINREYPWSSQVTVMVEVWDIYGNMTQHPYAIALGSAVKAAILDRSEQVVLAGPIDLNELDIGSDWINGKVVVLFTAAQMSSLPAGRLVLQVEVDDGFEAAYKKTIRIVHGVNI